MALLDAAVCIRPEPRNLSPIDSGLFAHELRITIPETQLAQLGPTTILPNGYLIPKKALRPAVQSFSSPPRGLKAVKAALKALFGRTFPATPIASPCLVITDEFSNGFFHWFGDVLPKLEVLTERDPALLADATLIIPAVVDFPYVRPSLAPFGLKSTLILDRNHRYVAESVAVCAAIAPTGNYRPEVMRALRDRYRSWFASEADRPRRRLFISRAAAPKRRIANEPTLWPILADRGFERVILEDLRLDDQIRLVAEAAILVGNHGAGLTNMLWMAAGTKVLELRLAGDSHNNCYFSLAAALGLDYYYLTSQATDPREASHTADIDVDPIRFATVLDQTIGGAS